MMSHWGGGMWGWGGWVAMGAMTLLTLVIVGLVVWAVMWTTRSTTTHRTYESPRAVLDRRLAAGEIDEDEYTNARRLIEDRPRGATP